MDKDFVTKEYLNKLAIERKSRILQLSFGLVISLVSWGWLVVYNWKLALAIMGIVWANNIARKYAGK